MDSIFKDGQEVWFTYEFEGKPYESHGMIDEVYYFNDVRKHKYKIISDASGKPFYIWEDKISFYKKEDRDKLHCVDCEYNDWSIYDNNNRCESCVASHRLFEPRKVCKTCKNRECGLAYAPCVICKDHNMWESTKVDKQYRGGYIYPVGARVRFKFDKRELIGYIKERYQDGRYEIRVENQTYVIKQDSILGYAAEWIDDPSIRKAFGLDVNKNDIYENIKKQINKDQLNFHYGLSSPFTLAPNDAAVPFELSEERKEYVRNDIAATMSYIHELHKNGFYGTGTDTKIFIDDILKEDNKMKKEQKKRNRNIIKTEKYQRTIKDITFNGPAVIVKFEPTGEDCAFGRTKGDKVVVVCKDGDKYDMKTGFLLAILKEFMNNQSYGNILEKLDSFDALDIPQLGKDDDVVFKFKVGDIVRFEHGVARFKIDKCTTFTTSSGKVVPRYRILRILGESKYAYSAYANENELRFADEVYHK